MALKSKAYQNARIVIKDKNYSVKRLTLLLLRISTQIELVTIFLGEDDLPDKDLKLKISLLTSLLEVKKKVKNEIKEAEGVSDKSEDPFSDLKPV